MSRALYGRMKTDVADRLLAKYGDVITVKTAAGATVGTYHGVFGTAQTDNIPASIVEQAEVTLTITAGESTPDVDHYVEYQGETYKIIYVRTVRPTDLTIAHILFLRK